MAEEKSKHEYAGLDQLSVKELEAILRGELLSPTSDEELTDHILEVIMEKERQQGGLPDVQAARADFDRLYRGLEEPLYTAGDEEGEAAEQERAAAARTRKLRLRGIGLAAAIVAVLLAVTTVPVLGHANVLYMLAHWTEKSFGFHIMDYGPDDSAQRQQLPQEFAELQAALDERNITQPLIPQYIPDGFQVDEGKMVISPVTGDIDFTLNLQCENESIRYRVVQSDGEQTEIYEKDDGTVERYLAGGVEHYLFSNNGYYVAAWSGNEIEGSILTTLPVEELKQIIDSIYKE